jgi:hypothetical protein
VYRIAGLGRAEYRATRFNGLVHPVVGCRAQLRALASRTAPVTVSTCR